jgi:hypothetical protein
LAYGAQMESGIDHLCHLPENHQDNQSSSTLFFAPRRRKKRASHSRSGRVPGSVWSKLFGRIHLNCRVIGSPSERYKSAAFWQTDQYLTVFSTRTEKEGNRGFPGSVWHHRKRKGAQIGLLFLYVLFCRYLIYMTSIFYATGLTVSVIF